MIRYFIVPKDSLTQEIIDNCIEHNPYLMRHSVDRTKVVIKCDCDHVPFAFYEAGLTPMTHEELLVELRNTEGDWVDSDITIGGE